MTDIPFPRSTRYDQPDGSGRETARWRWIRRGPQFRQRRPALTPGLRRLWKVGGVLWVLVALPFGVMQVATTLAHTQETVVKEFPAAGVSGVDIGNGNGSVTVVGSDTPVVRVTARISHGWARTGNDVELVDGRVRADTHCPVFFSQFCSVAYTVEVPRAMELTVDSDNGSVFASDLTGDVALSSDNGKVEAERLDGDLRLSSSNGRVSGRALRADGVQADSSNGRVELSFVEPPRVVERVVEQRSGRHRRARRPHARTGSTPAPTTGRCRSWSTSRGAATTSSPRRRTTAPSASATPSSPGAPRPGVGATPPGRRRAAGFRRSPWSFIVHVCLHTT